MKAMHIYTRNRVLHEHLTPAESQHQQQPTTQPPSRVVLIITNPEYHISNPPKEIFRDLRAMFDQKSRTTKLREALGSSPSRTSAPYSDGISSLNWKCYESLEVEEEDKWPQIPLPGKKLEQDLPSTSDSSHPHPPNPHPLSSHPHTHPHTPQTSYTNPRPSRTQPSPSRPHAPHALTPHPHNLPWSTYRISHHHDTHPPSPWADDSTLERHYVRSSEHCRLGYSKRQNG
jgi:hypothetical protein